MTIFSLFTALPFESFTISKIQSITHLGKSEIKTICDELRKSGHITGVRKMRLSEEHTNKSHLKLPKQ